MLLSYLAPNFRVWYNNQVEIPARWENYVSDPDVLSVIQSLIREYGKHARIFVERGTSLSKHNLPGELKFGEGGYMSLETDVKIGQTKVGKVQTDVENPPYPPPTSPNGWTIPLSEWDKTMSKVVGVEWEMKDEEKIKEKVYELMEVD